MPTIDDLEPLLAAPAEALDVEYKCWLDLRSNDEHKALLAKAAIALANEGGGFIVVGFSEDRPHLISEPCPADITRYDADLINGIIRRFASPSFHCKLTLLPHPQTGHETLRRACHCVPTTGADTLIGIIPLEVSWHRGHQRLQERVQRKLP
jgi:predicted HTH transcriptional regulator